MGIAQHTTHNTHACTQVGTTVDGTPNERCMGADGTVLRFSMCAVNTAIQQIQNHPNKTKPADCCCCCEPRLTVTGSSSYLW